MSTTINIFAGARVSHVDIDLGGGNFTALGTAATVEHVKIRRPDLVAFSGNELDVDNVRTINSSIPATELVLWSGSDGRGSNIWVDDAGSFSAVKVSGDDNVFSAMRIESPVHGLEINGGNRNQFPGLHVTPGQSADNTYDGVHVINADNNLVVGFMVASHNPGTTDPRYGWNVTDAASDGNEFCHFMVPSPGTAVYDDQGTDTVICSGGGGAHSHTSDDITNQSGVPGATVTVALDNLNAGGGFTLAQNERAIGGIGGLYKTTNRPVTPLSYVLAANHAAFLGGTFDARGPIQTALDIGHGIPVELPQDCFLRIMSDFNSYATGHPVLADMVTAGFDVGLVDRYAYRDVYGASVAGSGASGGKGPTVNNNHQSTMIGSSLQLAAFVYVDDIGPGAGGSDQRGGGWFRTGFKDIDAAGNPTTGNAQNTVLAGFIVGERWHYHIGHNGFTRIQRDSGSVMPVGSGFYDTDMPAVEDLAGTGIIVTSQVSGAQSVQYLKIYDNVFEDCTNGIFTHWYAPDIQVFNNMFYGAQKNIAGNDLHNKGTGFFCFANDAKVWNNKWQHTGRGVHMYGRPFNGSTPSNQGRGNQFWADTYENPLSHGWTAAERGEVYGLIIDGEHVRSSAFWGIGIVNGPSWGAPVWVDSDVPDGGWILRDPAWGGSNPTGSVANNPNNLWVVDNSRRTVGFFNEIVGGEYRHYQRIENGAVARLELTGSPTATATWKTNWTQGT